MENVCLQYPTKKTQNKEHCTEIYQNIFPLYYLLINCPFQLFIKWTYDDAEAK